MNSIHPTALVAPQARLGDDITVGPYSIIGPDVTIDNGCLIHNHVTITGATTLGRRVQVHPNAVLGGTPQDLKYKGGRTTLNIGENTIIRECCTLHVGTENGGGRTEVGRNNLIMAYVHVAHDCKLHNNIVIANAAQLAGHVHVHDGARISGLAALHHFVTIGTCAYVAGCAKLSCDVPPFTLAEGHPAKVKALNKEGMKRRGVSPEAMEAVKVAFKLCFRDTSLTREDALKKIEESGAMQHLEVRMFVDFLKATAAGKFGRALESSREIVPPSERDGKLSFNIGEKKSEEEEEQD